VEPAAEIATGQRKRILALDGGGVRGFFTIEILARMEKLLREHLGQPRLVLADHFQFMAGTSTGAIIATLLSWGESADTVRQPYREHCHEIFPPPAPWKVWRVARRARAFYGAEALSDSLRRYFHDEETDRPPCCAPRNSKHATRLHAQRDDRLGVAHHQQSQGEIQWQKTSRSSTCYEV
jgi:predicted acylesterase/phospholipase RssA